MALTNQAKIEMTEYLDEAFIQPLDRKGNLRWFARIACAGLYPRLIGPYTTQVKAKEAFEQAIDVLEDCFMSEIPEATGMQLYVENQNKGES